jgi:hypothetical protein
LRRASSNGARGKTLNGECFGSIEWPGISA